MWSSQVLYKVATCNPHMSCTGLGVFLQIECHYLQRMLPKLRSLMDTIERYLRESFFLVIFGG